MKFYASVWMSEWKSTRDSRIPVGTRVSSDFFAALLWFVDHPWKRKRVPVILEVDLPSNPHHVLNWRKEADGTIQYRTRARLGALYGTNRFVVQEIDLYAAAAERTMLARVNSAEVPGVTAEEGYKNAYDWLSKEMQKTVRGVVPPGTPNTPSTQASVMAAAMSVLQPLGLTAGK